MSTVTTHLADSSELVLPRFGWMATIAGSWTLAGGIAGGLLTAVLILTGRMHPDPLTSGFLSVGGAMLGALHGVVLGYIGHCDDETDLPPGARHVRFPRLMTALAAAGAFAGAVVMTTWLGLASVAARAGDPAGWGGLALAFPVVATSMAWATLLGWYALENAYARWPDHRVGSLLILGAFAVLITLFVAFDRTVPGTQLHLTRLAGALLALLITLWLAAPAIYFGLRLWHRGPQTGATHDAEPAERRSAGGRPM